MWLVFLFLMLIFLGLIFSNINITLTKIVTNIKDFDFNINISLYWFKFLKIFNIRLNKQKLTSSKIFSKIKVNDLKTDKDIVKIIKELKLEIDEAIFDFKIGVSDMNLTIILVVLFSMAITIILQKQNTKKVKYQVLPEFNKFEVLFEGKINAKIKITNIIKVIFKHVLLDKNYKKISKKYASI